MSANIPDFRSIPVAALTFSTTRAQTERRAHFDKAGMAELAASIKAHGVMQPILVRPLTDGPTAKGFSFEVVAGERRALASKAAGVAEIPATVRELTDEQCLELQLIENLQRQDLHELAEAEGYESLLKLGHSIEDMAAKTGKSKGTIYARMKLLALTPAARGAFYQGKIAASVALLLARIPVAKLQDEALKEVSAEHIRVDDTGDRDGATYRDHMSVRAAIAHIHQNYMLKLSGAPFKPSDPDLVPKAGACGVCPKRTGNQPELFGDVKGADVCTDPICFKQKVLAHSERLLAAAKDSGQMILTGSAAKKVAAYGIDNRLEGYVKLEARDFNAKGTYRQTLGKSYVPALLQDPESGLVIQIAPQKDVEKAHGQKRASSSSGDDYAARERAADKKRRAEVAYRIALFKAIHESRRTDVALTDLDLRGAAQRLLERLDHECTKRLFAALGWESKKRTGGHGVDLEPPTPIEKMSRSELMQLLRDCSMAHELQVWQHSSDSRPRVLEAAANEAGVNAKRIRLDLDEAAKAKAAAKKPKAKK